MDLQEIGKYKNYYQQILLQKCSAYTENLFNFALSREASLLDKGEYLRQIQLTINQGTDSIQQTLNDVIHYLIFLKPPSEFDPSADPRNVIVKTEETSPSPSNRSLGVAASQGNMSGVGTSNERSALASSRLQASNASRPPESAPIRKKRKLSPPSEILHRQSVKNASIAKNQSNVPHGMGVLVLSLKCPIDESCIAEPLNQIDLYQHLLQKHNVHEHRCLTIGCNASFAKSDQFRKHEKVHSRFLCPKCNLDFKAHEHLLGHYRRYHELGFFMCNQPNCDFMSSGTRDLVKKHQKDEHPPAKFQVPKLVANHDDHPRPEPALKPTFSCKFPQCTYKRRSEKLNEILDHCRSKHFPRLSKADGNVEAFRWIKTIG